MGQANRGRAKWWAWVACAAAAVAAPSSHALRIMANAVQVVDVDGPVSDADAPKTNGFSIKNPDR